MNTQQGHLLVRTNKSWVVHKGYFCSYVVRYVYLRFAVGYPIRRRQIINGTAMNATHHQNTLPRLPALFLFFNRKKQHHIQCVNEPAHNNSVTRLVQPFVCMCLQPLYFEDNKHYTLRKLYHNLTEL